MPATATATAEKLMTAEEFLALPDDGVERWLIRGQLREKRDTDMTMRNKIHSITEALVTNRLVTWLLTQPEPRGAILCGEAGFLLRRHPDTISAGADVAYITAAQADAHSPDTTLVDGPAVLIAEIMSPSDTTEEIMERVEEYLACGVRVVWVIHPYFRTVSVHRPGQEVDTLPARATLTGGPELPGFSCRVADFFR